jgi:type II secretory pathway component PulK
LLSGSPVHGSTSYGCFFLSRSRPSFGILIAVNRQNMSETYKHAHRYHVRRRRLSRLVLVSTILGLLSIAISFIFFAIGTLMRSSNSQRLLLLAAAYFGGGLLMLAVRAIAAFFHNRMSPSRRSGSSRREDFYKYSRSYKKDGAALVIVLGVLAVITLLVARAQINALQSQKRDYAVLLRARLQVAAADAARDALQKLAADEDLIVDHTNETWAVTRETKDPSGITTFVKVIDENRFFNINNLSATPRNGARSPSGIIMDLLTLCGDLTPAERVDALADWMDENDQGPFESRAYKDMDFSYGPPNRPLYSWGEWLHIPGFNRDYFRRHERRTLIEVFSANVVDTLSVIPGRRVSPETVNVNTAGQTVLAGVLGLENEELASLVIGVRNKRPIRSLDELVGVLNPDLLLRAGVYLDTKSRYFTVHAWAYADGRTERLLALVERNGAGDVNILQWVL